MAEFNLERIRFRWKNEWLVATTYVKDDVVYYRGKAYVCLIGHTSDTVNLTTDLNDANPKWELMFDGKVWKNLWTSETYYTPGDTVKFKGYIYECVTPHTSTNITALGLPLDISNWKIVATTYNWLNEWTINAYYNLGDVVRYNGIAYICSTKHRAAATTVLGLEDDQSSWTMLNSSDSWKTNWQINTRYKNNDIVNYGATSYRCVTAHTSNATLVSGLEADQAKWEIFLEGIEYKGDWTGSTRYKKYDVVKSGGSLWKTLQGHTSTTTLREDLASWVIYVPGLEYEAIWDTVSEYNSGDIVVYGGYAYTALTNNINSVPSVNGIVQDTGDWELLKAGYRHLGDWLSATQYKPGDVIRDQGYLYIAIDDSTNVKPNTNANKWQVLVTGRKWKNTWIDNIEYHLGDVVTYAGVAYICIDDHLGTESENRPDLDLLNVEAIDDGDVHYWTTLIQGTASNVLTALGDIRTHDGSSHVRNAIGTEGSVLTPAAAIIDWQDQDTVLNTFYVSIDGIDSASAGKSLNAPFRTVKYACEHVLTNVNTNSTNSTIFIKTGIYDEILPIKVPRNCALVGDELRSTVIQPAATYESFNMFFVNNGSGIRNMTLQGLAGTLPNTLNSYGSKEPTGGAFVSLDPGTGPSDTTVWITTKSCYVQNVTTFGTACIGMKIDGTLHSGGNKSIVANDFTQVISDGIGYWANEAGRSELVSVFTYFCYIGYFATAGGILRATNGNNSYGTFGSRAEGYSLGETPITAQIDNQTLEAQVETVHTKDGNEILAIGYGHAGQTYSNATAAISGTGTGASALFEEFRNKAVSQIRVIDPADSSTPGGLNYQFLLNNAQGGDVNTIILAAADTTGTPAKYIGMRVFIDSGTGTGQYAYITAYNEVSKVATVSKECNDTNGWESVYPGYPIETTLDTTTKYRLEPRVIIDDPGWTESTPSITWPAGFINLGSDISVNDILHVNGKYVALNSNRILVTSTDGITFTAGTSPTGGTYGHLNQYRATSSTAAYFLNITDDTIQEYTVSTDTWSADIALPSGAYESMTRDNTTGTIVTVDGNNAVVRVQSNGTTTATAIGFDFYDQPRVPSGSRASGAGTAFGNGIFLHLRKNGSVLRSADDGVTWTENVSAIESTGIYWNDIEYGNGRFVVVGHNDSDNTARSAYSFDGLTWYYDDTNLRLMSNGILVRLLYQNGEFIASQASGASRNFAKSKDGFAWQWFSEDSSLYTASQLSEPKLANGEIWFTNSSTGAVNKINTGAGAMARVLLSSSRIQSFILYDTGSNYAADPTVTVFDPEATVLVQLDVRLADGVLSQPVHANRGSGYVTATMAITGNGYADIYQTGKPLNLKGMSVVPGPGTNVVINGIDDVNYRLTKIVSQSGSAPNIKVSIEVSPPLTNQNSPNHNESLILRELYSQVRLTGHDFLDIGSGNKSSTAYPDIYKDGHSAENEPQPFNEVTEFGGGRVFYTSTDQDGNFRVGELFAVEQSTGVVSINADFFELSGLEELSLGAIQVGGSAVVIREFSKDGTFTANSNNIVPTQAAILKYLESKISGGSADALTNTLVAGQIRTTNNTISSDSGLEIIIPVDVNMTKGIDGDYLAHQFFMSKK